MEWGQWAVLLLILLILLAVAVMAAAAWMGDDGGRQPVAPPVVFGGGTTVSVQEPWFSLIAEGRKTVEGKPSALETWADSVGDIIVFQNGSRRVEGTITAVRHYPDLESYLKKEWKAAAPQAKSYEDALELYMKVRMTARGKPGEGEPDADGMVQVFSPGRVAARGGMAALEVAYAPIQRLAWLGKQLSLEKKGAAGKKGTGGKKGKKSKAADTLACILRFVRRRYSYLPESTQKAISARVEGWIRSGESDGRIVAALRQICTKTPCGRDKREKAAQGRTQSRIRDIRDYLTALVLSSDFPVPRAYLDVGCAEGSLTGAIGEALGLRKESEIHGCDIFAAVPANLKDVRFTYTQARSEALPYKTAQFQVVSCIMSLHHFANLKESLAEIHRVLAPGGLLLIREHDCPDEYFGTFLDFVHYFYAGSSGSEIVLREGHETADFDEARQEQLIAYYRTANQWAAQLKAAGFEKAMHTTSLHESGGRIQDAFRSFYGFYRRM